MFLIFTHATSNCLPCGFLKKYGRSVLNRINKGQEKDNFVDPSEQIRMFKSPYSSYDRGLALGRLLWRDYPSDYRRSVFAISRRLAVRLCSFGRAAWRAGSPPERGSLSRRSARRAHWLVLKQQKRQFVLQR